MNMRPQYPTRQRHGTITHYTAGCSCFECCEAHREYLRLYKLDRANGIVRSVDAAPVRRHIAYLTSRGWFGRAIAEQSMTGYGTIRNIRSGVNRRVRTETHDAIMALTGYPRATESSALVPARPTLLVIERLRREFTLAAIADAAGVSPKSLPRPDQRSVQSRTALRIRRAGERLRVTAPQSPPAGRGEEER